MNTICGLASKASLTMLIFCVILLFVPGCDTAERIVLLLSCAMLLAVFAVSTLLLKKHREEDET